MIRLDLSNRTALVTGSSRGIGYATAARLLDAGATVVFNGRTMTESLETAHRTLAVEHPNRVHVIQDDVADPVQVKCIVRGAFDT